MRELSTRKKILLRMTLFFSSLFITVFLTEVGLRLLGVTVELAREASFDQSKVQREDNLNFRKKIDYEKWIVALGDSITNGGNVSLEKSFPFQFYFNQKNFIDKNKVRFNILNHGKCESNTYQSIAQLRDILKDWKELPDIILYQGGAADRFSPISNQEQKEVDSYYKEMKDFSPSVYLKSLRLYKIYRGIKIELRNRFIWRYNEDFLTEFELAQKNTDYAKAIDFYYAEKFDEADKILRSMGGKTDSIYLEGVLNFTVDRFFKENRRKSIIVFTLHFLKQNPLLFKKYAKFPLHRMVIAYDFQSTITSEFIAKKLNEMRTQHKWLSQEPIFNHYYKIFKEKELSLERINKNRLKNLRTLAKICQEKGIVLVLHNYPADFIEANSALEKVAKEFNLPFVNHHLAFEKLIKAGGKRKDYLEDDEHATELGYKIMADNIWSVVENLNLKQKNQR